MDAVPARSGGPGAGRGAAGHLRRARGSQGRDRGGARRRCLAALPHPLHREPPRPRAGTRPAAGRHAGAHHLAQTRAEDAWAQHARVVDKLADTFPEAAALLADGAEDVLAYTAYPKETWKRIWSNNPQERLNREIRRRTDVVGIFPDRSSVIRLVGAVLAEQHDEWQVGRRYMNQSTVRESLLSLAHSDHEHDVEEQLSELQTVTA